MRWISWALVAVVLFRLAGETLAGPAGARDIDRQIRQILSAPEYNRVYTKQNKSNFFREYLGKLGQQFAYFVKWLRESLAIKDTFTGRIASFVFAVLVVVGFVVLMVFIIRRLAGPGGDASDERGLKKNIAYDIPSAGPLIRQAEKFAQAGDYKSAFKCVYMASISHLDDIRALQYRRSRTNWEYLRELKRGGFDLYYNALRPITITFDRKFYGRADCLEEDYAAALAVYEKLRSGAQA